MSIFGRKNRPETPVAIDPELGVPYGEPGSVERLNWIFTGDDYQDWQEARNGYINPGPAMRSYLEAKFGPIN